MNKCINYDHITSTSLNYEINIPFCSQVPDSIVQEVEGQLDEMLGEMLPGKCLRHGINFF